MRTSLVAGEAMVGDGRVGCRSRRHRLEGVVAGQRTVERRPARVAEHSHVAPMVGVGVVEYACPPDHFLMDSDDLPGDHVIWRVKEKQRNQKPKFHPDCEREQA